MNSTLRMGVVATLVLVVGAGVVFALNSEGSSAKSDAVAVLKAQGATCGSCAAKIEKALKAETGVASVEVDVDNERVAVAFDSKVLRPEILAGIVTGLGYGSSVLQVLTAEEYMAETGKPVAALSTGRPGGCGGGCCNRKRN